MAPERVAAAEALAAGLAGEGVDAEVAAQVRQPRLLVGEALAALVTRVLTTTG